MDGTSAVVAAREGGSAVIYAMFFKWTGERWEKGKIFLEPYEELLENEDHTYDFHLDMSGRTAMLGLPHADQVHVYEMSEEDGERVKLPQSLSAGGAGQSLFGHRIALKRDAAVVGASVAGEAGERSTVHVFARTRDGRWTRTTNATVNYPFAGIFFDGEVIVAPDNDHGEVPIFKYDAALNEISDLHTVVFNAGAREHGSATNQAFATGATQIIYNIKFSGDNIVYTTYDYSNPDWTLSEVKVLEKKGEAFSLTQTL